MPERPSLRRFGAVIAILAWAGAANAFTFEFHVPADQTFQESQALSSYALPVGPFRDGAMQTLLIEGAITQAAWVLQAKGLTSLQILAPMRDQLTAAGYSVLFECETFACGGFDFRFGTDIAAEPAMHVDLGDFRYLAAMRQGADGPQHIAIIVSRSSTQGFVQVTEIGKAGRASSLQRLLPPDIKTTGPDVAEGRRTSSMEEGLTTQGSVALDDLIFDSGSAELAPGAYASLDTLAKYLRDNPGTKVALVGHTDASGALAGNIVLSRERALSVRQRLIDDYAIAADQVSAEGVGYLAPRDSNLTETGLTRNRRVEVMLLVNP